MPLSGNSASQDRTRAELEEASKVAGFLHVKRNVKSVVPMLSSSWREENPGADSRAAKQLDRIANKEGGTTMNRGPAKRARLMIRFVLLFLIVVLFAPSPRLWAQPLPIPKFAYIANQVSNDISAYAIDATTGVLTPVLGSPFPAGTTPSVVSFIFSSNQVFAYVANQGSNNISAYSVNATTGVLTPIAGSPFPAGMAPFAVQGGFLPSGQIFAYVANQGSNDISAYTVNPTTGALTSIAGSPFPAGTNPFLVQFAFLGIPPSPKFAYVANQGSDDISAYTIDATTGVLTPVAGSPFAAGLTPFVVNPTFTSSGQLFAYVANQGSNDVSAYTINATTGVLTPVAGSPFPAGTTPVFVTPVGSGPATPFAYVANQGSNDISAYTISATTGVLTPVPGSPFAAGLAPFLVTFNTSSSGQLFAYVANQGSNDISGYAINATTGVLTPVLGSPFAAGTTPIFVAPLDPLGTFRLSLKFACVANQGSDDVSTYTIDGTTGALTPAPGSPFPAGTAPFFCSVLFQ